MLNMFNYTAELSLLQHTQLFLIIKTDILEIYVQPIALLLLILLSFIAPKNKFYKHVNNLPE